MNFIRLVTWSGFERLSRKGYEGSKTIYGFYDDFVLKQGSLTKRGIGSSQWFLFFIFHSFYSLFLFSSLCDDISFWSRFTSSFD